MNFRGTLPFQNSHEIRKHLTKHFGRSSDPGTEHFELEGSPKIEFQMPGMFHIFEKKTCARVRPCPVMLPSLSACCWDCSPLALSPLVSLHSAVKHHDRINIVTKTKYNEEYKEDK